MSVFASQYASHYDLFYADKDYAAEAAFVGAAIEKHKPGARSVLDLGCGSARHAVEFARAGFFVTGIDRSAEMITQGQGRIKQLSSELQHRLFLTQADATTYRSSKTFDAVASLFHVVSYQTSNDTLNGIFQTARAALQVGGLFVFDFWYGPAVLTQQPEVRVKRLDTPHCHLTRIAEPTQDSIRNVVDVKYTLIAIDAKTGLAEQTTEVHSMRYLFLPEIEMLATAHDFEVVETGEWLTGRNLHQKCWSGYVALRLVKGDQ
jgi:SAM-dependent methyltransferase